MSLAVIITLAVLAVFMGWHAGKMRSRAESLEDELAAARADYHSYRNMYGPNPVSVVPDTRGTISDMVLLDVHGFGDPDDFYLVQYNWNTQTFIECNGLNISYTPNARWYRLPLKKYEKQRLSR